MTSPGRAAISSITCARPGRYRQLRIGKQPYGILPVTSLNAWKPPAGQENQSARDVALRDFLIRLRDIWRRNFPEVPRLGRSEDIDRKKASTKTWPRS